MNISGTKRKTPIDSTLKSLLNECIFGTTYFSGHVHFIKYGRFVDFHTELTPLHCQTRRKWKRMRITYLKKAFESKISKCKLTRRFLGTNRYSRYNPSTETRGYMNATGRMEVNSLVVILITICNVS